MEPLTYPLDHEATHGLRLTGDGNAFGVTLVPAAGPRRFALERALRQQLRLEANGEVHRLAAETDRLDLPPGTPTLTVTLGERDRFPLLEVDLASAGAPAVRGMRHLLSPFETRFLADTGTPHPVPHPGSGPSGLVTDLHAHLAGCPRAEDLVEIGVAAGVAYPADLLERAGIRTGRDGLVPLASLSPGLLAALASRLALPLERQVPFAEMETVYLLRSPITKAPDAFVPILRRIASDYAGMGVVHAELSFSGIVDSGRLEAAHREVPRIERETGVALRFLVAMSRHDDPEWDLDVLERIGQLASSRLIAGVDFMGHETNSTRDFAGQLRAVAAWADVRRPGFVVRVHAGENPAHPENVRVAAETVRGHDVALRIGHGLHGGDRATLALLRELGAIVEFNLNSNLALNNVQAAADVPLLSTLDAGVSCVLGTDGYGLYRTTLDREAQAARLAGVGERGLDAIRQTERAYLERRRRHEERWTAPVERFAIPAQRPPRFFGPGVAARRKAAEEARDRSLRERLEALQVPLLDPAGVNTLLAGRHVVSVAGAWRKSWEAVSPEKQALVRHELAAFVDGLAREGTVLVAGGTAWGVEGIVQQAARSRGIPVLGTLVATADPAALAPGLVTHATVVSATLHGKAAGLYPLLLEHGGACLFVGGGPIVSDEIQAAANLRLPLFLMDGPEGASSDHARLLPERAFRTGAELLGKLAALARWRSAPDPYWHLGANPTVDVVVVREAGGGNEVLLVRRDPDAAAEPGAWALPGGFQLTDAPRGSTWAPGRESAAEAAVRELLEETGLDARDLVGLLVHVGDFEGEGRDPRDTRTAWGRSRAFVLRLPPSASGAPIAGGGDVADARWVRLDALPPRLAFDHGTILRQALRALGVPFPGT